jgi:hypothetical protein
MTTATKPLSPFDVEKVFVKKLSKLQFIDTRPPIESEIRDPASLSKSFNEFPIVPYSGYSQHTSHSLVSVLYNMKNNSSTFAGVIEGIKIYGLKGLIDIVKNYDDEFNIERNIETTESEKKTFVDLLRQFFIFKEISVTETACMASESFDSTGMIGIEVVFTKILDVPKITVIYHHPTDYVFKLNEQIGSEVYISKSWDFEYLKHNPPKLLPVYPYEYEYPDGTTRTFFYVKNGGYTYGRPIDLAAIYDKYTEWKIKQYLTKKVKKQFFPSVFLEYSDGDMAGGLLDDDAAKAAGFSSAAQRVQNSFSNAGDDPIDILATTRPENARPAFIHEFKGIQNSEEFKTFLELSETNILKANNISKMLAHLEGATGFSTNVFWDVFTIQNKTKILERQEMLNRLFNKIITYGFEKVNIKSELGISFSSKLKKEFNEHTERLRSSEIQPSNEQNTKPSRTNLPNTPVPGSK